MKTKNLINALLKITKGVKVKDNETVFTVGSRSVAVVDQNGTAIGLPMIDSAVVHNGNHTIRNLVDFLTLEVVAEDGHRLGHVYEILSDRIIVSGNGMRFDVAYDRLQLNHKTFTVLDNGRGQVQGA